jgi:hypothetical protein
MTHQLGLICKLEMPGIVDANIKTKFIQGRQITADFVSRAIARLVIT